RRGGGAAGEGEVLVLLVLDRDVEREAVRGRALERGRVGLDGHRAARVRLDGDVEPEVDGRGGGLRSDGDVGRARRIGRDIEVEAQRDRILAVGPDGRDDEPAADELRGPGRGNTREAELDARGLGRLHVEVEARLGAGAHLDRRVVGGQGQV